MNFALKLKNYFLHLKNSSDKCNFLSGKSFTSKSKKSDALIIRYHDHWRNTMVQFIFIASLIEWLETGNMLTIPELEAVIGGLSIQFKDVYN